MLSKLNNDYLKSRSPLAWWQGISWKAVSMRLSEHQYCATTASVSDVCGEGLNADVRDSVWNREMRRREVRRRSIQVSTLAARYPVSGESEVGFNLQAYTSTLSECAMPAEQTTTAAQGRRC